MLVSFLTDFLTEPHGLPRFLTGGSKTSRMGCVLCEVLCEVFTPCIWEKLRENGY
jgi:hypothetical protein